MVGCGGKKNEKEPVSGTKDSTQLPEAYGDNEDRSHLLIGTEDIDIVYHNLNDIEHVAGKSDEEVIRAIFDEALLHGQAYDLLNFLANEIGGRISGSPQAAAAVEWAYQVLDTMRVEKVWKQGVLVPRWIRGKQEVARVVNSDALGTFDLSVCALGGSVATPDGGITAPVIEVKNFDELRKLGMEKVKNKIVFFNRRMDPRFINTFYAYGNCVDQRWAGAMEAGKLGALGVIVRSMTLAVDDYPHTGSMGYEDGTPKIPAMAVSTKDAIALAELLKEQSNLRLYMNQQCKTMPDVLSYNVVGEIRGSEYPDEIILIGGHLDSWDLGDGAHDDGAGVVQSMEVLRLLMKMGVRPKRTIRAVMFMNEENGLAGGKKYAEIATLRNEDHIAAIETDRGGFAPRYFTVESADEENFDKQMAILNSWLPLLKDYGIADIKIGGSGADIGPLKPTGTLLFGLVPESQRYFDYHHCAADTFEAVNKRELHLGAAAMAALVFLISEHGI
ncbi:M20/M25/M40 family metallo-hydrolase [bacterium]|nr:M20/M25/M40 family metallo-hydrolase [bacterium]